MDVLSIILAGLLVVFVYWFAMTVRMLVGYLHHDWDAEKEF